MLASDENSATELVPNSNLKGRIAEVIVQEIFRELGYEVYRFGAENVVPALFRRRSLRTSKNAELIRAMPDFVITKGSTTNFIEVKYRTSGEYPDGNKDREALEINPFDDAYIVLLSPYRVLYKKVADLKNGKRPSYLSEFFSNSPKSKKIILKYCEFCKKIFGKT